MHAYGMSTGWITMERLGLPQEEIVIGDTRKAWTPPLQETGVSDLSEGSMLGEKKCPYTWIGGDLWVDPGSSFHPRFLCNTTEPTYSESSYYPDGLENSILMDSDPFS